MKFYLLVWVTEENNYDEIIFLNISDSYEKTIETLEEEGYNVDYDGYTPLTYFFKEGKEGWGEIRELGAL